MKSLWHKSAAAFLVTPSVLVGIGNRLRGDDAFGPAVLDRLRGKVDWPLVDAGETPENFIGKILSFGASRVLLLDAAHWGGAPGEIGFFSPETIPCGGVSTHGASLRLFCDLLKARGGCATALLGAEPVCVEICAPLSPAIAASVTAVEAVLLRLARPGETNPSRNTPCRSM